MGKGLSGEIRAGFFSFHLTTSSTALLLFVKFLKDVKAVFRH